MYSPNFKDQLYQSWLDLACRLRYYFDYPKTQKLSIPSSYGLSWQSNFSTLDGLKKDFNIIPGNYIGDKFIPYHPDYLDHYYDPYAWVISREGLQGYIRVIPKTFNRVVIPNSTPKAESLAAYKYGIFIFNAKLPLGRFIWPALWFSGEKQWPPEIDLVECFPRDYLDYNDGKRVTSNVHVKVDNKPEQVKSTKHWVVAPAQFHEYALWWTPNFIKIYYDGYLVRCITTPSILEKVAMDKLKIIIGAGTSAQFTYMHSPLVIRDIKVYQ